MSKEEALLSLENAQVKNPEEALPFLATHGLLTPDPGTNGAALLQTLTTALLELATSSKTPQAYKDLLCAFAFALEKTQAKDQPQGPQEDPNLAKRVHRLEQMTEEQVQQTSILTRLVEETKGTVESSTANLERCVENACAAIRNIPPQQPPAPQRTYAGAAKEGIPKLHAEILARSEAKYREVVIKCDSPSVIELTEKEIVTKANLALEPSDEEDPRPGDMTCLSVRRARDTLIILELDRPESVNWLRNPRNKSSFLKRFGTNATFLERSWKVLAEFVPITLDNENPAAIHNIEQNSHIEQASIRWINWIRNPNYRKKAQKVAHAIIAFDCAENANDAIRHGLNIEGRKVCTHRQHPEPTRCYKCQILGRHFAKQCTAHTDTCGTCGDKSHTTKECTVTDPAKRYCVNCETHGHASWDRNCATFATAKKKMIGRNKEASYKYFPIADDPTSWITTITKTA